jgi:methyl-accepting chemotaxis protein
LSRSNSTIRNVQLVLDREGKVEQSCLDALDKLVVLLRDHSYADMNTCLRNISWAQWQMVIVGAVGLALSLGLALLVTRSITRPMLRGVALSEALAKGDLTQRLGLTQRDEVGQVAQALDRIAATFAQTVGQTRELAQTIAGSSTELATISNQMLGQSEEVALQAGQVAGATEQMSANVNTMAAAAEEMSVNVASISSASEEISVNVGTVSSAAEQTTRSVQAVTSAIQEATRTLENIARETQAGSQVTSKAMDMAQQATTTMNCLDRAAGEIGKVTETIKTIALQTNLLALNATIEATSAGEAGKGFAVVAYEIKDLANQSGQAAEDIARRIECVQASTREAVQVIQGVTAIIHTINEATERNRQTVDQQSRAAVTTASNLGEASKGVENIARAIAEVAKGANDMSHNASDAAKGANEVSGNAAEAARAVQDISSNIHGVSQATKDNTVSAQKVNQAAAQLKTIAEDLRQLVGQFKVEE